MFVHSSFCCELCQHEFTCRECKSVASDDQMLRRRGIAPLTGGAGEVERAGRDDALAQAKRKAKLGDVDIAIIVAAQCYWCITHIRYACVGGTYAAKDALSRSI